MEGFTQIQEMEGSRKAFPLVKLWGTGLSMFSMFFGAGNVIFPLVIGYYAQDQTIFAILGLLITAVAMPFAGMLGIILFDGDYSQFFKRIGAVPGFLVALVLLLLLGPLGSTPRCIALAYSTMKMSFPGLSITLFSAVSCVLIYLFSFRKNRVVDLLGWFLTPLLLISLLFIIVKGLLFSGEVNSIEDSSLSIFLLGLMEGYNTMDLLAAFFFSAVILASLKVSIKKEGTDSNRLFSIALTSSLIGAALLAIIYIGFSYVAALHGQNVNVSSNDQLLGALAIKIIGANAGFVVCLTIALACLTTAIALCSVFADFLQCRIFSGKMSYQTALIVTLCLTFFVATYEFTGISSFLSPVLQLIYPALIVLTFLNIAHKLFGFKSIKLPVLATFLVTLYFHV